MHATRVVIQPDPSAAQAGTSPATPPMTQTAPSPAPLPGQGEVAFVPKAGGPPDTSNYMIAGYIVTFVVYLGYIALVLRRMARVRRTSA